VPVEVTLDYDAGRKLGTLRWKPSPAGRRPARYRVYASDETGFSVRDARYPVNAYNGAVWSSGGRLAWEFPYLTR
jgi:hypothetical protein